MGARSKELMPAYGHCQLAAEAFADAVLTGSPVPPSPQDSINNAKVLDALANAMREGRDVRI